jgi:predicted DNA-binding protein (MmcQ/YjbR family)
VSWYRAVVTYILTPTHPKLAPAEKALAELALAYPETVEENPWDHRAFKVRGKTFMFLTGTADQLNVTVKLPHSGVVALELPFCEPTGYGLGKSGWVSAMFGPEDEVPIGLIAEWMEESFVAIAPKRLVAARGSGASVTEKPAAKKKATAKKKPAAKKKTAAKKRARPG